MDSQSSVVSSSACSLEASAEGPMHFKSRRVSTDYAVSATTLGEGVSGRVCVADRKSTKVASGLKYAVKTMQLEGIEAEKQNKMRKEVDVLMSMDHPHVISVVDVYEQDGNLNLVMECLEGGDLCDKFNEVGRFAEQDAAHALWQMMLAIQYVHSQGVVHRDIKIEHFMYESKDSKYLKLIDFGLSEWWDQSSQMDKTVGTLGWVAPEVLRKNYTSKCDVWGLGCIAFTLLLGHVPFSNKPTKESMAAVLKGEYRVKEGMWDHISANAGDFVRQLLHVDAEKRPTVREALEHPWMKQWNFEEGLTLSDGVADALESWQHESSITKSCMQIAARCMPSDRQKQYRDTFLAMDADKNGSISLDEFVDHTRDIDASRIYADFGTGKSGEILYSEFLAAMLAKTTKRDDPVFQEALARFAVNFCTRSIDEQTSLVLGCQDSVSSDKALLLSEDPASESMHGDVHHRSVVRDLCKGASSCYKAMATKWRRRAKEHTLSTE